MIEIGLTKGHAATISDDDADLAELKWTSLETSGSVYAYRKHKKTTNVLMHRVILSRMLGRAILKSERVDHIDGNGLNNRRENLRLATNAQNSRHRRGVAGSSSKYKVVNWHKRFGKWQAVIRVDGKSRYLGMYHSEVEAAKAYDRAAREHFGEFCLTNFDGHRPAK